MTALKVQKIDGELAVTLTPEIAQRLSLVEGSDLLLIAVDDGELVLSTREAETARQVAIGRKVMADYSETFAALAR